MYGWQVINKSVTGVMILTKLVNGGSLGDCLHEGHWLVWDIHAQILEACSLVTAVMSVVQVNNAIMTISGRWCWGQTVKLGVSEVTQKGFLNHTCIFQPKNDTQLLGPFYWRWKPFFGGLRVWSSALTATVTTWWCWSHRCWVKVFLGGL